MLNKKVNYWRIIMRILCINPIGTDAFNGEVLKILENLKLGETKVDCVSLPAGNPLHLEYHSYEAMAVADIVRLTYKASSTHDAVVISCFYDTGLREAREVSGMAVVTAPCQAAIDISGHLGNTFSILVGRRKWIPKIRDNVRLYGREHALSSIRSLDLTIYDFINNPNLTYERLIAEGKKAVEEDGAEVIILGTTGQFGFFQRMQDELGVPVIDAAIAPFKYAEFLADTAKRFGWYPSRICGSEAPPKDEIDAWNLFRN
jgi:allantoin racemase